MVYLEIMAPVRCFACDVAATCCATSMARVSSRITLASREPVCFSFKAYTGMPTAYNPMCDAAPSVSKRLHSSTEMVSGKPKCCNDLGAPSQNVQRQVGDP